MDLYPQPLDRLAILTVNLHVVTSRLPEGCLLIEGNISTDLNLSLSWNVNPVSLRSITVSHERPLIP